MSMLCVALLLSACGDRPEDSDAVVSVFTAGERQFIEPNPSDGVIGAFSSGGEVTNGVIDDADGTDAEGAGAEGTVAEGTVAEGTDAEGADAEGADAEGADAEGADAGSTDAGGIGMSGAGSDFEISSPEEAVGAPAGLPDITLPVSGAIESLALDGVTLDQMFQSDQTSYTASAPALLSAVAVIVNGAELGSVPLAIGQTVVAVSSQTLDQDFFITITRAGLESLSDSYLKDGSSMLNSRFGSTLAIEDDLLAVLNSRPDPRLTIFRRIGDVFQPEQILDMAGQSLSISNQRIAVGDVGAMVLNDPGLEPGVVRILERVGGQWLVVQEINSPAPDAADAFGQSVSLSGDLLAVGVPGEDSSATLVNGDATNNDSLDSGAVYLFTRDEGEWPVAAYLKAEVVDGGDRFGSSVALGSTLLVIGAPGEASSATVVQGNAFDNSLAQAGAAYLFGRTNLGFEQISYLKAFNTRAGDRFGSAVALDRTTVVIGAPGQDGVTSSLSSIDSGAVYVFGTVRRDFQQTGFLTASNAENNDRFGYALAIEDNLLVISAPAEDGSNSQSSVAQPDNGANDAGAVYLFSNVSLETDSLSVWEESGIVRGAVADPADVFGTAVGLSRGMLAVGVPGESANPRPLADPSDNSLAASGAVYVFR